MKKFSPPEDFPLKPDVMLKILRSKLSINGIENLIEEYKMINSNENMSLEYEFNIDGGSGCYYVEMDAYNIIKGTFKFRLNKKRGCYFNIEDDDVYINEKIFESKEFYELISNQIEMYWGKHTLLSILYFEMGDKSDTYINSNISINLMKLMTAFENINFRIPRDSEGQSLTLNAENQFFGHLVSGTIEKKDKNKLDEVEILINQFFKSLFNDVVKAFYKKNQEPRMEYSMICFTQAYRKL